MRWQSFRFYRASSRRSLLSQHSVINVGDVMFDGKNVLAFCCRRTCSSAMAVSISLSCGSDIAWPKRFRRVTTCVLPVICLTAMLSDTCLGGFTRLRLMQYTRSWPMDRTLQWTSGDSGRTRVSKLMQSFDTSGSLVESTHDKKL